MSLGSLILRDLLHSPTGWIRPFRLLEPSISANEWIQHAFENVVDPDVKISSEKDKFQLDINVKDFKPHDIKVKTVDDNAIVIEGKHESRQNDHGYIFRQFTRKYVIPPGHDISKIVSSLSADGVLTIKAPKVAIESTKSERVIPIETSGSTESLSGEKK